MMVAIEHTVRLSGDNHFGTKAPPLAPAILLRQLPDVLRQCVLMAFEGRTAPRGRPPRWLEQSADIRFVGISGNDDTVLHFEVPTLGEAADEIFVQTELWNTRPDPGDTCFDLLGDVILDVQNENVDSNRFDSRLLKKFKRFDQAIGKDYRSISLFGHRFSKTPAIINETTVANASRMVHGTPSPNRVRVVGTLDMIRASTEAFAIKLDDGQEVSGVIAGGDIENLSTLWLQRVLVLGDAIYRPSGSLLRIDAEQISIVDDASSMWSKMPKASRRPSDRTKLVRPQGPKSGLAAIIGKWPGDETDEEIDEAMRQLS